MRIDRLTVSRVRNISNSRLEFQPRINLFYGQNGAGKTGLLEALHLLSDARTFRHNEIRPLIQDRQADAVVHGVLLDETRGQSFTVGVSKARGGETRIRFQQSEDISAVALARKVPLLALVDQGEDLSRGGSRARRRVLDWGLFHVEQRFYPAWQRMRVAVRQRNQLLRRGNMGRSELPAWNLQLCATAQELDEIRQTYCQRLQELAEEQWRSFLGNDLDLRICYERGWDAERDLAVVLQDMEERDLAHGYTTVGPHRADLRVSSSLGDPVRTLSRGQLKMTFWGLRIAQLRLHNELSQENSICLVDDLPAELDRQNQEKLLAALWDTGSQLFVTALEPDLPMPFGVVSGEVGMFHVEQGVVLGDNPVSGAIE